MDEINFDNDLSLIQMNERIEQAFQTEENCNIDAYTKGPNLVNVSSISAFTVEFDELFNRVLLVLQRHKEDEMLEEQGIIKKTRKDGEGFNITMEQFFYLFQAASNELELERIKLGKYRK